MTSGSAGWNLWPRLRLCAPGGPIELAHDNTSPIGYVLSGGLAVVRLEGRDGGLLRHRRSPGEPAIRPTVARARPPATRRHRHRTGELDRKPATEPRPATVSAWLPSRLPTPPPRPGGRTGRRTDAWHPPRPRGPWPLGRRSRDGGGAAVAASGTQHDVVDVVRSRRGARRTGSFLVNLDVPCG
jgi:hypothetical protein